MARDRTPGTIRALGTIVPVKDADGNVVGERMDNLVHASANEAEAEREIKLWFQPNDIMPSMRAYPDRAAEQPTTSKTASCSTDLRAGQPLPAAPGDTAWKSDLEALRLWPGRPAGRLPVDAVVAKYLINEKLETP